MSRTPFLDLYGDRLSPSPSSCPPAFPTPGGSRRPARNPAACSNGPATPFTDDGGVHALLEVAVSAVQAAFPHLSKEDIAFPPHHWFDAALARQIAVHVMVAEFQVPKNRIVRELQRNKAQVQRAMETVEERMRSAEFKRTYGVIVATARERMDSKEGEGDA